MQQDGLAPPLTVVTFKWGERYTARHVNVLAAMVARNYGDHRFVCVTDDPVGVDVETAPLWDDFAALKSPHNGYPSCYRRLKLFDPGMRALLGPRFVSLDLDTVITGDLRPLFDRREDFVCLGNPHPTTRFGGGLWLMDAGCRPFVWTELTDKAPRQTLVAGLGGSDQAWLSLVLGDEATFGHADGVYWFRQDKVTTLPKGARLVNFNGHEKPWERLDLPWVREHWHA